MSSFMDSMGNYDQLEECLEIINYISVQIQQNNLEKMADILQTNISKALYK